MIRTDIIAPVPELLKRQRVQQPDKVAFEDQHRAISYAELERNTAVLASQLAELDIGIGDRVAIFVPNSVTWVEVCLAVLRAGAVIVPIS